MNLGIYIQVPFCQTKCTYCNFHTGVFPRSLYAPYVDAVCRELAEHEDLYRAAGLQSLVEASVGPTDQVGEAHGSEESTPRSEASKAARTSFQVDTIYLGGGTPSLLDPAALGRILTAVGARFPCQLREVTLEADPETVTLERAARWRALGITRVSLGVQSFHDLELVAAGRRHRRRDIFAAMGFLRTAGFGNVSFDLIAGLPHQTERSWGDSLAALVRLRPEHASIYMLEVDEGSRLGREALAGGHRYGADALPDDDSIASFYERACALLVAESYRHYEISNFARADFCSRHNLKYWRREPYLGLGAGAHSFNGRQRWANAHDPALYVEAVAKGVLPVEQIQSLTPQQALEEELFLGLRQLGGINLARMEAQYGVRLRGRAEELRASGLVEFDGTWLRLAPSRLAVANEVFVELLG